MYACACGCGHSYTSHTQDETQDDAYIQIDTIPCVQIYTDRYRSLFFDALRGLLELGFSQAQLDPYRLMVLLECVCMCVYVCVCASPLMVLLEQTNKQSIFQRLIDLDRVLQALNRGGEKGRERGREGGGGRVCGCVVGGEGGSTFNVYKGYLASLIHLRGNLLCLSLGHLCVCVCVCALFALVPGYHKGPMRSFTYTTDIRTCACIPTHNPTP